MAPKSALRVRSSGSVASNRRSGARGGVESAGVWLADAPVATHTPTRAVSAAPHLRLTWSKLTEQVYGRRGRLASLTPGLRPGSVRLFRQASRGLEWWTCSGSRVLGA